MAAFFRQHDRKCLQGIQIIPRRLGHTHHNVEAPVALEHESSFTTAHGGCNCIGHLFDRQAISRNGGAIELNVERW